MYSGSREAFATALCELAERDNRCCLVSADSLKAMRATAFAERFPEQYVEVGIAEQNAVGVAAGMASCGLVPFVATYAGFLTMRACEQVRTFVAYPNLNVKLVGINGGLLGGEREGVTHQFFEDVGILRTIPNMTILTPADPHQVYHTTLEMLRIDGPVYLRCASGREPEIYTPDLPFAGGVRPVREYGEDLTVFCSGYLLERAVRAVEALRDRGVNVSLVDVGILKPFPMEAVMPYLRRSKAVVTVEDHNVIGGLGSAVAQLAAEHTPLPMQFVGLRDQFPSSGPADALLDHYNMSIDSIISACVELMTAQS